MKFSENIKNIIEANSITVPYYESVFNIDKSKLTSDAKRLGIIVSDTDTYKTASQKISNALNLIKIVIE